MADGPAVLWLNQEEQVEPTHRVLLAMPKVMTAALRKPQRPREFTLSFNPCREICHDCGQLNFDGFYVCEKPSKKNVEKTA